MKVRHCHKCDENYDYSVKGNGLTRSQKAFVLKKVEEGKDTTPTAIFHILSNMPDDELRKEHLYSNNGVDIPSVAQIETYIRNADKDIATIRNHVDKIKELCESMSALPEDEDEPFVMAYQVKSADDFNIVVSTRRLLHKFDRSHRRNIDGTYKLLRSGYPVLVMGLDDANRRYHPAILSISATERRKNTAFK